MLARGQQARCVSNRRAGAARVQRRAVLARASKKPSIFDPDLPPPDVGKIVICGGGIMGVATAFYLSELGVGPNVTVVEPQDIACAASGKAGGFLALDWNDTSPVRDLARKSYALHEDLADMFGYDRIGYRPVNTLSVAAVEQADRPIKRAPGQQLLPDWVDGHVVAAASMGSRKTTAQVHPYKLTATLMEAAQARGAQLIKAKAMGLQLGQGNKVTGVTLEGGPTSNPSSLAADVVVLAMGPWTNVAAAAWGLPLPRITGQKYHSVLIQPPPNTAISADMLFTNFAHANGREVEPEVYPRPDGTVYVCGEPQALPVPPSAAEVEVVDGLAANIAQVAGSLSSKLKAGTVVAKQVCYLPTGPDGVPIIGAVPGHPGVFVATGHTCWGILNGPATGKALAELITGGVARCCDLTPFSPQRFLVNAKR